MRQRGSNDPGGSSLPPFLRGASPMRAVPTLIALALVPYLAGNAGAAVMARKGAKKEKHPVHGQVVAVQLDGNKTSGTITVLVHHHKKSATAAAPVEKTFK